MTIPDAVPTFCFVRGTLSVLLSIPHVGTHIQEALRGDFTDTALQLADTDWHFFELCQCLYMDEQAPFDHWPDSAARLQPTLTAMFGATADALAALQP